MNTEIPASTPQAMMPRWTRSANCGSSTYYTFADGHTPSAIAHNGVSDKTYYAWVMPHETQPTTAEVRVMLKGESSRPETATYKDYTKTYFTNYAPKSTGAQGKVSQGKVHRLTANATHRVALPIEYVTEYNLAGGEGLTYIVAPGVNNVGLLSGPTLRGVQPAGVTGSLRFSSSHNNDQSGYYNLYKINGDYHAEHNVNGLNLSTATLTRYRRL